MNTCAINSSNQIEAKIFVDNNNNNKNDVDDKDDDDDHQR